MLSARPRQNGKVWSAVKRDYFAVVEANAGFRIDINDKRRTRLLNAWRMLHAVDRDAAVRLATALLEMAATFDAEDDRRQDPRPQQVYEFLAQHESLDAEDEAATVLTLGSPALQRRINEQFSRI